ncbi:uncharacterized protein BO97DRAFT_261451 [Aspergillus homomorphus CBS 101889]|uniref:Uncharacterized protein n=1 Tax=Aspergillus homomorphus (strain CBS 101889) TaxID=1450537 RepID=A0A395I431_ASPHC|nr:hypothetical protein BO97DRAFT_261451 [Aspergillus homomorphus CBS 101889]RAL14962.1 hypothetical protein BO97DRAFT_261451 [Aspergillus homomorphus CBS 101889]
MDHTRRESPGTELSERINAEADRSETSRRRPTDEQKKATYRLKATRVSQKAQQNPMQTYIVSAFLDPRKHEQLRNLDERRDGKNAALSIHRRGHRQSR